MVAAFVHGATIDTVLSTCVCEGAEHIADALRIPETMGEVLVSRLARTPNETTLNYRQLSFLATKATDVVFLKALERVPDLLERDAWGLRASSDPLLRVAARAHELGRLAPEMRDRFADRLESAVVEECDLSCLEAPAILALIPPIRLVRLGTRLQADLLTSVVNRIEEAAEGFDPDHYFESVFDKWSGGLEALGDLDDIDPSTANLVREAREALERGKQTVSERLVALRNTSDATGNWRDMLATASRVPRPSTSEQRARSVFDDVDQSAAE